MGLGGVDKQSADVGFFDGGESAEGRKLFYADFATTGFSETGGVEDF